jgi:tRNA(adenine34) deaminase
VIVDDTTGRVIATARNCVEAKHDATAHAELEAIRKASAVLRNWRLPNCTLYSTLEPCAMCLAAAQGARLKRVVYGEHCFSAFFPFALLFLFAFCLLSV